LNGEYGLKLSMSMLSRQALKRGMRDFGYNRLLPLNVPESVADFINGRGPRLEHLIEVVGSQGAPDASNINHPAHYY